jgi:hypothetical protein
VRADGVEAAASPFAVVSRRVSTVGSYDRVFLPLLGVGDESLRVETGLSNQRREVRQREPLGPVSGSPLLRHVPRKRCATGTHGGGGPVGLTRARWTRSFG